MSELIDRQALKAAHGLGTDCADCKRDARSCQYDRDFSRMDFCEWIDDAPTASPWRRVEEELPDKTTTVLVWVGVNYDGMGMYPEMRTALWHTVSKHFFVHHDESIRGPIIGNVTHWMPLPEPPKEEA